MCFLNQEICGFFSNLDVASTPEYKPTLSSRVESDSGSAVQYPVFDRGTHMPQLKLLCDHTTTTMCVPHTCCFDGMIR